MAGEKTAEEEALAVKLLEDIASKDKDDAPEDADSEGPPPQEGPEGVGDEGEETPPDPDEAPDDEDQEPNEGAPAQDNTPSTVVGKGLKLANETNEPVDVTLDDLVQGISEIISKALETNTPLIVKAVSDQIAAQIDTKVGEAVSKALAAPIGEGENATSISKALTVILGRTSTIKKGVSDLGEKVEAGNSASDAIAKALPSLAGSADKAEAVTKALQTLVRTTPAVSEGATGTVVEKGTVAPPATETDPNATGLTVADGQKVQEYINKAQVLQGQIGKGIPALTNIITAANSGKITKALLNDLVTSVDQLSK